MDVAMCGYNGSRRHHCLLMYRGRCVWFALCLREDICVGLGLIAVRLQSFTCLFPSVACEMFLETLKGPRVIWSLRRSKSFLQLTVTLKLLGEQEPHSSLVSQAPSHSVSSSSYALSRCDTIDPKAFPRPKQTPAQPQEFYLASSMLLEQQKMD